MRSSTLAQAPMSSTGQEASKAASSAAVVAMPKASPASTMRGSTYKLPIQPHRIRPGIATATAVEKTTPAAASE